MGGKRLSKKDIGHLVNLRKTGHSLPEIRKITGRSSDTIYKYVKDTSVKREYVDLLREKQGGSKARAATEWDKARRRAIKSVPELGREQLILIMAALYWGEGTKKELNFINGDPVMVKTFVRGLEYLGVPKSDVRCTVRVYDGMSVSRTKEYWKRLLGLIPSQIVGIERVTGRSDRHKLLNGMCRVRVTKGAPYFKQIISIIDVIKDRLK